LVAAPSTVHDRPLHLNSAGRAGWEPTSKDTKPLSSPVKVAVVQTPPVLLDRTATIALICERIGEVTVAHRLSSSRKPILPATRVGSAGCGPAAT
jgi:hypothetical protein